jgi:iron uptake system EfeUOB component EfeO/EfeM
MCAAVAMVPLLRSRVTLALACGVLAAGCGGADHPRTTPARAPYGTAMFHSYAQAREAMAAAQRANLGTGPEMGPLPVRAFARPVARYRAYSGRQADAMQADVAALAAALAGGDRAGARAAWARAYGRYLRIGAAYGALGDLDAAIDGTPGSLRGGVHDPQFSGLHRIEHGLWRGAALGSLRPWTARLARDVRTLRRVVRRVEITPLDYATRAHEILEDAQRDMLSGRAAPWSGAGLQATADSLAATRAVIDTLRPLLNGREDTLPRIEFQLLAFGRALARVRRAHGGRLPALGAMTRAERERVGGTLGVLLEALAAVPGTLETQLPPKVPSIASQAAHG